VRRGSGEPAAQLIVRLLPALLAVAAVASATGCGSDDDQRPPAGGPLPPDFVGMVADNFAAVDSQERRRTAGLMARSGVGLVRQPFDWTLLEPTPGAFNPEGYDDVVRQLALEGIRVLPVLLNPPPHRSLAPAEGAERGNYPPRDFEDFGQFAAKLAQRYGPGGDFWRAESSLPRLPIRSWQVWNEPSLPVYWRPRPDAADYARLLGVTAAALRRVDPGAEIVSAGIPESRLGVPFSEYVNDMYDAGAGSEIDALAIHPYARDATETLAAVEGTRELLSRRGFDTPIWVTEIGWADGGPASPFTVGGRGQANRVREVLPALAERRERLGLRGIVYFSWQDAPGVYEGGRDFFGLHTGLSYADGRPKPAYRAFVEAVRELSP
jgi:polysaccharide biosynthesis protein PslG